MAIRVQIARQRIRDGDIAQRLTEMSSPRMFPVPPQNSKRRYMDGIYGHDCGSRRRVKLDKYRNVSIVTSVDSDTNVLT